MHVNGDSFGCGSVWMRWMGWMMLHATAVSQMEFSFAYLLAAWRLFWPEPGPVMWTCHLQHLPLTCLSLATTFRTFFSRCQSQLCLHFVALAASCQMCHNRLCSLIAIDVPMGFALKTSVYFNWSMFIWCAQCVEVWWWGCMIRGGEEC